MDSSQMKHHLLYSCLDQGIVSLHSAQACLWQQLVPTHQCQWACYKVYDNSCGSSQFSLGKLPQMQLQYSQQQATVKKRKEQQQNAQNYQSL